MTPLLTLKAAAARTGLTPRTLREAITRRELAHVRLQPRGRIYVSPTELDGWIAQHQRPRGGTLIGLLVEPAPRPLEALLPPAHERRFS